jgi:transcriptional regulator with XRE-family HTH domain
VVCARPRNLRGLPKGVEIFHNPCYLLPMTKSRDLYEVVAESVRELRRSRGWSQEHLAERAAAVGLPWNRSWVADLENGRRYLSVEELILLPLALGLELSDLLGKGSLRIGSAEVSSRTVLKLLSGNASQVRKVEIRGRGRQ